MKRVAVLEAERDELRFRLTKQQEAREAVEAERDALREENERLRDTCDIRGSNWERAEAQLSAAREALAALAPPEATEGEGK